MIIRKLGVILGLSILGGGCASIHPQSAAEKWQNFNQNPTAITQQVAEGQTMVVFIRESNAVVGPAVNLFVEGEYLTSLQAGGYKAIPLCRGISNLNAAYTDSELNYTKLREQNKPVNLTGSSIHYFAITQAENNQLQLQPLTEQQAQQAIQNTKEQVNTLPRIEKNLTCPTINNQQRPSTQLIVTEYGVSVSTLFDYNKSDVDSMLVDRSEIEMIAKEIIKNSANIQKIEVIGHTDPVGSARYNQRLSLQRAETVKKILIQKGITHSKIVVEGRGEDELVVNDCDSRVFYNNKAALDECNAPNRRVEIVTYSVQAD